MRLVTIRVDGGTRAGRVEGEQILELPHTDIGALLADVGIDGAATVEPVGAHALADADLAPVVPRPSKIFCLGLNYAGHIRETGREVPRYPTLFAKFPEALVGPRDPIVLPDESDRCDWEVELALVIGRPVRRVSVEDAGAAIAGYTICNDVTMRDWQQRTLQWLQGKTWERSTPLGPTLVTPDELDPGVDLALRGEVDGEVMQDGRTSDLVFGPAECVAYISTIVTLQPGDVISTGTPSGIGDARTPPIYLRPGQVVRTVVEGIGELVNRCVTDGDER
ncbi:MAG: fumarylacetoacetate hydrolase family protein [Acidimicrobiia bacterium]